MLNYLMLYNSFYLIFFVLVKLLIIDYEMHYFTFSIFFCDLLLIPNIIG